MHQLELQYIRCFVILAREKSFTRAASVMHLTQPAISHQIKALETSVGVSLFDRSGKVLALTEAGKTLLTKAEQIIEIAESAQEEIEGSARRMKGVIKIGTPMELGVHWLLPKTREFFQRHLEVSLEAHLLHPEEVKSMLLDHSLDIALMLEPVDGENLYCNQVVEEELVLVGSPHYWEKHPDLLNKDELLKLPFLAYEHGDAALSKWLRHHKYKTSGKFAKKAYINSFQGMKSWLLAEMGVAVVPRHSVTEELAKGLLQVAPLHDSSPSITNPIYLVMRESLRAVHRYAELLKFLGLR